MCTFPKSPLLYYVRTTDIPYTRAVYLLMSISLRVRARGFLSARDNIDFTHRSVIPLFVYSGRSGYVIASWKFTKNDATLIRNICLETKRRYKDLHRTAVSAMSLFIVRRYLFMR